MMTKEQFLAAVAHEHQVCKHLFSKIPPDTMNNAPAPGTRTPLELLRYLTRCAAVPARAMIADDWSGVREDIARTAEMPPGDFPACMDAQLEEVRGLLAEVSERDLAEKETHLPWGVTSRLGEGLINTSLCFLTAYRMQLFLYLKIGGQAELNTYNCWRGQDPPA